MQRKARFFAFFKGVKNATPVLLISTAIQGLSRGALGVVKLYIFYSNFFVRPKEPPLSFA
jgi:hypothetical protein